MNKCAFYNDIDPFCSEWTQNLIDAGEIPFGVVDRRPIQELRGSDVEGFTQVSFFNGISGWPLAIRLAGWPDNRPVWTGSCPCQPFSAAGKRKGTADDRHLWPEMYRLVSERKPGIVLGEQVASKDGLAWLDGVFSQMETSGYACWATDTCAAGISAPHIRQRLFWVAVASSERIRMHESRTDAGETCRTEGSTPQRERLRDDAGNAGSHAGRVGIADSTGCGEPDAHLCERGPREAVPLSAGASTAERLAAARRGSGGDGEPNGVGNTIGAGPEGRGAGIRGESGDSGSGEPLALASGSGWVGHANGGGSGQVDAEQQGRGQESTPWSEFLLIPCQDGKVRRISSQPGDEPLAYGIPSKSSDSRLGYLLAELVKLGYSPAAAKRLVRDARSNRVGRLRGYGNAIVPVLAAEFIRAVMEVLP